MSIDNPITITTHYYSSLRSSDTNSGLLISTDVTVNDTKQRVSKVTYDDLGRMASVVRGNGSTGAIEQTTAYYPYGAVIPDLGTGNSNQPFKYGSKELVSANGLNMYDFGARLHYPAIQKFL